VNATIQNARIYGRFSSKPQERGDSKRRQIEGAKAYAAKNGMAIVASPYFDEGVSGKAGLNLEREFGHLLKDAREGEAVLCEELDRIGRQSPFVLGKLVYDLVQKGLTVIAWQEGKVINKDNIDTLDTQMSVFTSAAVGHADNTRKILRLIKTTTEAFRLGEQGIQSGTLVKYLPQCFTWNEATKAIELDPAKTPTIKRIFTMFNDGIGKTTICQTLNKENVPTLYHDGQQTIGTKKPWMETSIKKILYNESYARVLHVKGHRITCIPEVVSRDTFDKAQLLLQRYSRRAGKTNGRVNNLFNGLAVCKHCGGTVNVSVSPAKKPGGKVGYAYRCKNARLHKCEHHKMLNAFTVEYLFFTFFFMSSPEQSYTSSTGDLVAKIEAAQAKLNKLTAAISNLYDMAESGDIEAKDRIAKRKIEKMDIEQELTRLKGQIVERANFPAEAATVTHSLSDGMVIDSRELPAKLANNEIRIKLRASLPSIFEKVIFDTTARTVEGILKEGVKLNTFYKDITVFQIPRVPHSK
jgi:hypothetical protein